MRLLIRYVFLLIAAFISEANAVPASIVGLDCQDQSSAEPIRIFPEACLNGKVYQIYYKRKTASIIVVEGKKDTTLQRIPKGFDPAKVGAEVFIGFLPDKLQVYKSAGILAYVSSIRTNGGDGGGQCGAGAEIFLNFLSMRSTVPKILSKILIGSCDESIELMDQDMSTGTLGKLSLVDAKLSLQFMFYRKPGSHPMATISADLKRLEFEDGRQP